MVIIPDGVAEGETVGLGGGKDDRHAYLAKHFVRGILLHVETQFPDALDELLMEVIVVGCLTRTTMAERWRNGRAPRCGSAFLYLR